MSLEGIIKGTKKFIGTTILGLTLACSQGGNLIQTQQGCVTDTDCNADLGRYCNYDTGECEGGEPAVGDDDEVSSGLSGVVYVYGEDHDIESNSYVSNVFELNLGTMEERLVVGWDGRGQAGHLSPNHQYLALGTANSLRYLEDIFIYDLERNTSWFLELDLEECDAYGFSFLPDSSFLYGLSCSDIDYCDNYSIMRREHGSDVEEVVYTSRNCGAGGNTFLKDVSTDGRHIAMGRLIGLIESDWFYELLITDQNFDTIRSIEIEGRPDFYSWCGERFYFGSSFEDNHSLYSVGLEGEPRQELEVGGQTGSPVFNHDCTKAFLNTNLLDGDYVPKIWGVGTSTLSDVPDFLSNRVFAWRDE